MKIEKLTEEDIPELVRIGKEQLGHDYIDEGDFTPALEDGKLFCMVASVDEEPAGFAIGRVFGSEDEPEELALPKSEERDLVVSSGTIGLLDSVAVDRRFVGHGIGHALCIESAKHCRDRGCGIATSMAWVHPDGVEPIARSLTQAGFSRTGLVIPGYWNQWVDPVKGHDCPICGAPCHCSAALWIRKLRCVRPASRRCRDRPPPCWSR